MRLDWDLGLISGETLIVRRDLMNHAPIQQLAHALQQRAQIIAGWFEDVVVVA